MNASKFLDTNILLYAYDLDAPAKRATALRLVELGWTAPGDTAISVQVLQELHVNLVKRGVSLTEATRTVRDFAGWPVVDNTLELLELALEEQARWEISLWDSLILAAARASGASELITEDLSHGQNYGGVKVVNPFL
ncbi:MAG: PIN domain-containing protein [Verrucomicrobia bacterium]|nr:PIN domain-containing protein [Verrucomicrobiota bacterium]